MNYRIEVNVASEKADTRSWSSLPDNIQIMRLNNIEAGHKKLVISYAGKKEIIKDAPEEEEVQLEEYNVPPWALLPDGYTLWDNQISAVNAWVENNYQGIFTIATAGGKTLAALAASSLTPKNALITSKDLS